MAGAPTVVVVGAASRDVVDDDPRGWRLGGGVTYSAFVLARLGLRVGALMVADERAAAARELDALRAAGVELVIQPGSSGPVFVNVETPEGRVQEVRQVSDAVSVSGVPDAWRTAGAWLLAPVAGEVRETWATVPAPGSVVALGWQGLLRRLVAGEPVEHVAPRPSRLLECADIVGLGTDDVAEAETRVEELLALLRPSATLLLTDGSRGGTAIEVGADGQAARRRRWSTIPASPLVDPVGAGDAFLAGVLAARLDPTLTAGVPGPDAALVLGAACASLTTEGPGLDGVGTREAVLARIVDAEG